MGKDNIGEIAIYYKNKAEGIDRDMVAYRFIAKLEDEFKKKGNEDLKDRLMLNMRDLTEIIEDLFLRVSDDEISSEGV